jgi:aspartyl-tRNA(Asn)/glutamyl-tRNA(Gln) amidotransferase subunit B
MIEELGIKQIQDSGEIIKVVLEVMEEFPDVCKKYKEGKTNAIDFLVGQVMRKTK